MAQSLRVLTLTAAARNFWDNHKFEQPIQPNMDRYVPVTIAFARQIDSLELPISVKSELKLAMLEYGKRKIAKEHKKQQLGLSDKRPTSLDEALREFLPKYFYDRPHARIDVPALNRYFPEEHQQRIVVDFFFGLALTNPRDDPSALTECWTSEPLASIQTIFLDNLQQIWLDIYASLLNQYAESRDMDLGYAIVNLCTELHYNVFGNETFPWFVFEVLTEDQKDKFLGLMRETAKVNLVIMNIFVEIFCHWPWQEGAFDMCFAKKKELDESDIAVLRRVSCRKQQDELQILRLELLPRNASFYLKVENFGKEQMEDDATCPEIKRRRLN